LFQSESVYSNCAAGSVTESVTRSTTLRLGPQVVLCLQRSAVTTCLLRKCGVRRDGNWPQKFPSKLHAWTEVDGQAINERRDVQRAMAFGALLRRTDHERSGWDLAFAWSAKVPRELLAGSAKPLQNMAQMGDDLGVFDEPVGMLYRPFHHDSRSRFKHQPQFPPAVG